MINYIWFIMIFFGLLVGVLSGNGENMSNDMCLFLVLNAACIQLVPSTVISIRATANSSNPGVIIIPAIISTAIASICGVICCKVLQKYF